MTRYSKGISLGMVSLALLSVVCLALTQRFSEAMLARTKRKGRQENWKEWQGDEEDEPPEDSLADTCWIMLGLMLQQGADVSLEAGKSLCAIMRYKDALNHIV